MLASEILMLQKKNQTLHWPCSQQDRLNRIKYLTLYF